MKHACHEQAPHIVTTPIYALEYYISILFAGSRPCRPTVTAELRLWSSVAASRAITECNHHIGAYLYFPFSSIVPVAARCEDRQLCQTTFRHDSPAAM
jgi:hypothetical protein